MLPVPPIETIKSTAKRFAAVIKNNHACFDFFMMLTIFLVTLIELISLYLRGNTSLCHLDAEKCDYLVNTYPLLMQITICIFATFFILKIFRYKSCIYTQATTILYSLIQLISLIFIIFKFGVYYYDLIVYPIFLYLTLSLIIIKTIRWFIYQ